MRKSRIIKFIESRYQLSIRDIHDLEGGYRNECFQVISKEHKKFVFIIYKDEVDIEKKVRAAHIFAHFLETKGFPVRSAFEDKNSKLIVYLKIKGKKRISALYNYLEGQTIPWEAYTRRHLKSIGKTMSDMHFYAHKIQSVNQFPLWSEITESEIAEMSDYFSEVSPWIERKLEVKLSDSSIQQTYESIRSLYKSNQEKSIIHYDFVRGNILFSNELNKENDTYPITGILDLEKCCFGPIIADIARTLSFLIIDCKYKKESTVRKRFIVSGYNRRGKSNFDQKDYMNVLNDLINFFLMRDFYKFLESNPYEDLYMNEHYIRTRDYLIRNEVLTKA